MKNNPKITILLSTYNGEKYLDELLLSIYKQTYSNYDIIVRDDGSTDKTLDILQKYDLTIIEENSNVGVQQSFSKLLEYALEYTQSEYFMLCDQDDVWNENKVFLTLKKMITITQGDTHTLVHSDLKVVDESLQLICNSFWKYEFILPQRNNFNSLLIQNTITGCTVMINRRLAKDALPIPKEALMHDWWLGLVASKFGIIDYIEEPLINYRQHKSNSIGAQGFSLLNIFIRVGEVFYKDENYLKNNIIQAQAFLNKFHNTLDDDTINMLEDIINLDKQSYIQKRKILFKYKLFKHGIIRNIGLFLKI